MHFVYPILKRIHFDGAGLGANGHKLQFWIIGQGAGLVRESMFNSLMRDKREGEKLV